MSDMEMYDVKGQFHKKFNAARATIYTADWEPDKAFKIQGNVVPYVSINKMKRNIAPALLKNGIDFGIDFDDLQMRQNGTAAYWSVRCTMTFFDQDTGYSESSTAVGGCGATDKGINICQTFALKQVLGNLFLLIDGIEPEDLENVGAGAAYHKKTEEEIEEVKSEILSNKNVVRPIKEETPAETPKEAPRTAVKSVDVDAQPKFELAGPQKNTIAKIEGEWEAAAKEGRTTPENYNQMSIDRVSLASAKDVVAFIRKYKTVF